MKMDATHTHTYTLTHTNTHKHKKKDRDANYMKYTQVAKSCKNRISRLSNNKKLMNSLSFK